MTLVSRAPIAPALLALLALVALGACAGGDRSLASPEVACGGDADAGARTCSGRGPVCCWDSSSQNGTCLRTDQPCTTSFEILCDGPEDCGGSDVCCAARDGKGTSCVAATSCELQVVHPPCSCAFNGCCKVGPGPTMVCTIVGCPH